MTRDEKAGLILLLSGAVAVAVMLAKQTVPKGPPPAGGPTGLQGMVTIGPIAPVMQPGVPNSRPYADARIDVYPPRPLPIGPSPLPSDPIATARSGADGSYGIALAPGQYLVVANVVSTVAPGVMSVPPPQSVTVEAGQVTMVNFAFDTGIR
jgi:hypothetical protein